jgi:RNA polymerase sigma-70 factor (ECF subfamily)
LTDPALDGAATRRGLLAGDEAALRAFHGACFRPLYAFCYHRLGRDHHAAEEVVQETMVLALDRIEAFDPGRGDLHTWLAFLSRNVIRRVNEERRRFVPEQPDQGVEAESPLEALETQALVSTTLERLPERYRTVLEAKYVRGESVRSIAAATKTTEKAVESLLVRAREAFKSAFPETETVR